MARARSTAGGGRLRIEAETLDVRKDEEVPPLVAYVFGQNGRLLGRNNLDNGKASLPAPSLKEPESLRVVVGPPIDSDDDGEVLAALMRLDAPELQLRSDEIKDVLRYPIDRALWRCWFRFCTVRGKLLRRVTTGGLHVDLPVCGAEVEIYEVDPIPVIIAKIPDIYLERIRDLVRIPWPPPPPEERFPGGLPFPPIPPGPGPDPAPFLGGLVRKAGRVAGGFERQAIGIAPVRQELRTLLAEMSVGDKPERLEAATAMAEGGEEEERIFQFAGGEDEGVDVEEVEGSLRALADDAPIRAAAGTSLTAFKSALLANVELVRPLICWLWPAVTMQLVATATTDDCGKFSARIYVGCSTDQPDLYFRAFRRIGFFRIPIYGPTPVGCHTWWNYACGSEVTLITTSPFAHTCPPCQPVIGPAHWVLAMAVGNTSLAAIHGTGPNVPTAPLGHTAANSPWGDGSPFGGDLGLRFEFDNTIRPDLGVRYYRVRWRKAGTMNPWLDLDTAVWRHYAHWVGSTLMIEPYKLGPQPVGATPNLFEIPPALPPTGQWVIADAVGDTTSAWFPSAAKAPAGGGEGLYEFELTLFDGAGAAVNATSLGIVYVMPKTVDLTTTIQTQNAASLGLGTAGRLFYQLYVDNNLCTGAIGAPTASGTPADPDCGLLRYTAGSTPVDLPYTAKHPFGYATYEFDVYRGTTHRPGASEPSGGGRLPVGGSPWTHSVGTTASYLLETCSIAGFAETLSVVAMATNGWSRQSQYDFYTVRAFALAHQGA
jgi:hypothetical protein